MDSKRDPPRRPVQQSRWLTKEPSLEQEWLREMRLVVLARQAAAATAPGDECDTGVSEMESQDLFAGIRSSASRARMAAEQAEFAPHLAAATAPGDECDTGVSEMESQDLFAGIRSSASRARMAAEQAEFAPHLAAATSATTADAVSDRSCTQNTKCSFVCSMRVERDVPAADAAAAAYSESDSEAETERRLEANCEEAFQRAEVALQGVRDAILDLDAFRRSQNRHAAPDDDHPIEVFEDGDYESDAERSRSPIFGKTVNICFYSAYVGGRHWADDGMDRLLADALDETEGTINTL